MKDSTRQWLEYAARDLKAAELILEDPYLTNICLYHCQQTIEKSFKAILEESSLRVPRIHSVTTLYDKLPADAKAEIPVKINVMSTVDDIYIDARYPTDLGLLPNGFPSLKQAKDIYKVSKRIFIDVDNYLKLKNDQANN